MNRKTSCISQSIVGFTLIETLLVTVIIGILAAIMVPSWVAFINTRQLNAAQEKLYLALREAQNNAKRDKVTWQVSFRENNSTVQWAVHPASATVASLSWQKLEPVIRIVDTTINSSDPDVTTFKYDSTNSLWKTQFNYKGNGQIGKITLATRNGGQAKRCVFVSTLLGAMRTAQDGDCVN
ncbi:type II secretion system protein [Chroococcidiopsis sp. FACHB-1243]|uniref:type II secretion system protein n=1 Tax=Chroococcidiopsis sp. [FACHB-1243] TaxID=2692781 RepID=UPI0017853CDE|nr:type II secretion system protein [Chroococcidiopsis sp. [FACHB-1243]]MBD2308764.1 type II secretion system protein [Chroococcidiopsis sp. [FACHB-1243]]